MIKRPTILIPFNRGHLVRLLLYSGVVERLANLGCQIVILTPSRSRTGLEQIISHANITFDRLPMPGAYIARHWERIYRYYFQTILPTASSETRLEWIKENDPRRYRILTQLGSRRLMQFRRFWIGFRHTLLPGQLYRPVFAKHQPDLVVTGTAGLNLEEYYLLRYARQHGTRSLCTLQSWDLLTTKGDVFERPDIMLVWNDENVRETIHLFGYAPEAVRALGVPHFDLYFKPETFVNRDDWLAQHGLVPDRKVLLVTPGAMHIHQNLPDVIDALVDGMNQSRFSSPVQVLIRPHPSVYLTNTPGHGKEADLVHYESLHPLIKGYRPVRSKADLYDNSDISEMHVLANSLYHADVMVDFYGTVSVEAAFVDTPVVYADVKSSFKADSGDYTILPTAVDYQNYAHLKNVLRIGGARTARNREELYRLINQYLEDNTLDRDGRRHVARAFCAELDGCSAERMAMAIYQYALGNWPNS